MHELSAETAHTAAYWDERYGGTEPVWSGRVNPRLVEHASELATGTALDIGCGEGGDAGWLAAQGWTVLAVDVSAVVVGKARAAAAKALSAEVAARITWQQADILTWQLPADAFELVSVQFLHLTRDGFADLNRRLAAAVRVGGTLLLVNHDPSDHGGPVPRPHIPELFLTADELVATLDPADWRVEVAQAVPREFTWAGNPVTIHDTVLRAVRR